MRRVVSFPMVALGVVVATGVAGWPPTMASAAPGPGGATPSAGAEQVSAGPQSAAQAGKKVCAVTDERLKEISGLVATRTGFVVVNDSSDQPARNQVFFLSSKCKVTEVVSYPGGGPRDTEDLALSPDGKTLWIADIGDNTDNVPRRSSVAVWNMPVDGAKKPVLNRLTYPDGPHDAEALLINGDGTPIVITKDAGKAVLYVPTGPLRPKDQAGVALKKAGEVKIPASTTSNPLFAPGRLTITGAAQAPGGGKVALRTYADAFEWDVSNGDVLAALQGKPRMTPLPDEPWGEAITYSADGKTLLTVSDIGSIEQTTEVNILQYVPSTAATAVRAATKGKPAGKSAGPSWFDRLTLQDITYMIGGVGVLGALLVGLGVFGIVRARRSPAVATAGDKKKAGDKGGAATKSPPGDDLPAPDHDADTATLAAVRKPAGSGAVYGGRPVGDDGAPVARPAAAAAPAGSPAGQPAGSGRTGSVYGSGSGVYGGRPVAPPGPDDQSRQHPAQTPAGRPVGNGTPPAAPGFPGRAAPSVPVSPGRPAAVPPPGRAGAPVPVSPGHAGAPQGPGRPVHAGPPQGPGRPVHPGPQASPRPVPGGAPQAPPRSGPQAPSRPAHAGAPQAGPRPSSPPPAGMPVAPPAAAPAPTGAVYGGAASRVYGGGTYRSSGAELDEKGDNSARSGQLAGSTPPGGAVYGRPQRPPGYPENNGDRQ